MAALEIALGLRPQKSQPMLPRVTVNSSQKILPSDNLVNHFRAVHWNKCYNMKRINKLSWLLNFLSSSHLKVNVDKAKGHNFVYKTVINLRQLQCVPRSFSCYGSQIRCVWVSSRPQEDPGIKVSWSLSLPQPSRTIRITPRRKEHSGFSFSAQLC